MVLSNYRPKGMDGEDAVLADASEDEEDEESDEEEEDSDDEIGLEVTRDFCIHQVVCSSEEGCAEYERKVVREHQQLKARERELSIQRKGLVENEDRSQFSDRQ